MKPFLKWLGNKYSLIERIKESLPSGRRLVEPFLGSGAVFLNTDYSEYYLSDVNADLINLYQVVQKDGIKFINYSKKLFIPANNDPLAYYDLREEFNSTSNQYRKAALFLYLNKHGFNGLFRYNSQGKFNVSFGRYDKPYFPEAELLSFHEKAQKAVFKTANFLTTMELAKKGDVVYCDPPYVPLSETSNFTGYSATTFGINEQQLLVKKAEELSRKGIPVIISNQSTPWVQKAYKSAEIISFDVQRFISCQGDKRGKVKEILAVF